MPLEVVVKIEVYSTDGESRFNEVTSTAAEKEASVSSIRRLANEAASRAEAGVNADRPPVKDDPE